MQVLTAPFLFRHQAAIRRKHVRRLLCTDYYIDQWQASTIKPNSFYEKHAVDKPKKYFYSIDLQGRVFLEESMPKNLATSMKDVKFLDFLYKNLRESTENDLQFLPPSVRNDYPYVSLCGTERNFIRPADAVVVFHSMNETNALSYGGTLSQEFDPSQLAISIQTGRLYHELNGRGTARLRSPATGNSQKKYGLIKSSLSVKLSDQIVECNHGDDDHHNHNDTLLSGLCFRDDDNDSTLYQIPYLLPDDEPGEWSMPYIEGQV